ncbi:MAG: DUF3135 domain-containing protein [Gammaproteobacteria bacterium]|nr:DUF3135 domain-containing protein [Gammaproteobacteria bacterium]
MSDFIDFDSWQELARSNPRAFEARRREVVNAAIAQVPHDRQHRLRCLQWRIEKVCASASNPISASVQLSNMMWERVSRQQSLIHCLFEPVKLSRQSRGASILTFPPRRDV